MTLTTKQRDILKGINGHPTARNLSDQLETPRFRSARYSYDEVYGQLRALEKKSLVRRVRGGRAVKWEVTDAGKTALEQ